MCRWLAYSGSPVQLEDLLYKPDNSLVMQSKHARMGVETTNGDGFGVGWYGPAGIPGVYHSTEPAWNDRNLRELSAQPSRPRLRAHPRDHGSAVQQTNCHPFRHGRWLWMHNGLIADFPAVKRDLALAVEPALYPADRGIDRLRAVLLPRPHLRAGTGPARGGRLPPSDSSRRPAAATASSTRSR